MPWFLSDSLATYSASAGGLLRASPAQNTILLTVTETLRTRGSGAYGDTAPLFGWWEEPGREVSRCPWPG